MQGCGGLPLSSFHHLFFNVSCKPPLVAAALTGGLDERRAVSDHSCSFCLLRKETLVRLCGFQVWASNSCVCLLAGEKLVSASPLNYYFFKSTFLHD